VNPSNNPAAPSSSPLQQLSASESDDRDRRVLVLGDETARQIQELVDGRHRSFRREYVRPVRRLAKRLLGHLSAPVGGVEAVVLLEGQLEAIEAAIARRLRGHSQYYWMHLIRRIPPVSAIGASDWNIKLSRRVLDLAVLKHGQRDPKGEIFAEEFRTDEDSSVPRELTYYDVLHSYQVEQLAYLHDFTTGCLRRVWKGGVLRGSGYLYAVDNTFEQEVLIECRDARTWEHSGYLTGFGTTVEVSIDPAFRDGGTIFILPPNIAQAPFWPTFPTDPAIADDLPPFVPNYLLVPFRIDGLLRLLALFDDSMETRLGFRARDVVAFVWGMSMRQFGEVAKDIVKRYHLLQRAYVLMGAHNPGYVDYVLAGAYMGGMRGMFGQEVDSDEAMEMTRRIRSALTYESSDLEQISLWDGAPAKMFLPLGSGLLCDYSAMHDALRGLVSLFASEAGELGNIKGDHFQSEVEKLIRSTPGCRPWLFKRTLRADDGRECEIDASFVVASTLYVVECKAMAQPYLVSRGEIRTLERRWSVLMKHCTQASEAAQFIRAHRSGRNFEVPDGVSEFEWVVVTPDVEYVPTMEDRYWLDPFVPRVLTPRELVQRALTRD